MRHAIVTILAGLTLALTLAVASASAHVGVTPREAPPDSSQTFVVRVPNERDEPTVRLRLEFPAGLTVSRFQPKPGWTYELEKDSSGKIVGITWSGGKIGPNVYDEFAFIARTPKEIGPLAFRAYQTYQSGATVEWAGPGGAERPAPLVEVKAAPTGVAGSSAPSVEQASTGTGAGATTEGPASASAGRFGGVPGSVSPPWHWRLARSSSQGSGFEGGEPEGGG